MDCGSVPTQIQKRYLYPQIDLIQSKSIFFKLAPTTKQNFCCTNFPFLIYGGTCPALSPARGAPLFAFSDLDDEELEFNLIFYRLGTLRLGKWGEKSSQTHIVHGTHLMFK